MEIGLFSIEKKKKIWYFFNMKKVIFLVIFMGVFICPKLENYSAFLAPKSIFTIEAQRRGVILKLEELSRRQAGGKHFSVKELETLLAPTLKTPYADLPLSDLSVPTMMADEELRALERDAENDPGARLRYARALARAGRAFEALHQIYFYAATSASGSFYNDVPPLEIRSLMINALIGRGTYSEWERCFVELIRIHKNLESREAWMNNAPMEVNPFAKNNFYRTVFDLVRVISPITQNDLRKLCTVILSHLLEVEGIAGFGRWEEGERFLASTGVEETNSFSQGLPIPVFFRRADLSGADLSHLRLEGLPMAGINLEKANLLQSKLNGSLLSEANLNEANLEGAILTSGSRAYNTAEPEGANLNNAHLQRANLRNADLREAHFVYADLRGADLRGAVLGWAVFTGAFLNGARIYESQKIIFTPEQLSVMAPPEKDPPNPASAVDISL